MMPMLSTSSSSQSTTTADKSAVAIAPPATTQQQSQPAPSSNNNLLLWVFGIGTILAFILMFVVAKNRKRSRYYTEGYRGNETNFPQHSSSEEIHHYHHCPAICRTCGGSGKGKKPMMRIQRGGIGMPRNPTERCPDCGGTGKV